MKLTKPISFEKRQEQVSNLVYNIINVFENILYENNMSIPDENREGNEEESCIYGKTYYNLEDKIKELVNNFLEEKQYVSKDKTSK